MLLLLAMLHAASALVYHECVVPSTLNLTLGGAPASELRPGTRYQFRLSMHAQGRNGGKPTVGSAVCEHVCPDGAAASFVYSGVDLVCDAEIAEAECVPCTHVCHHKLSVSGVLTSADACYADLSALAPAAADAYRLLRATWLELISGQLTGLGTDAIFGSALPSQTTDCLKSYAGFTMPQQAGTCVDSLGEFCYKDYCISARGLGRGYTNQFVGRGASRAVIPALPAVVCRLTAAVGDGAAAACDECVVPVDLNTQRLAFSAPAACRVVVGAVVQRPYGDDTAVNAVKFLVQNSERVSGLEFTAHGYDASLARVLELIEADLAQRPALLWTDVAVVLRGTPEIRAYAASVVADRAHAYPVARTVWVDFRPTAPADFEGLSAAEVGVNALSVWRTAVTVGIVDPTLAERNVFLHFKSAHFALALPAQGALVVHARVNLTGSTQGVLNPITNGRRMHYYYARNEPMVYCPYIQMYVGSELYLAFPYFNTAVVPFLGLYKADMGFTCTAGEPVEANTCADALPPVAMSVITHQLEPTTPGGVYYNAGQDCYWAPSGPRFCSYSEVARTSSQTLYAVNERVVQEVTEFETHYLGFLGNYKVIDAFGDTVEVFAIDQICNVVDLKTIPMCVKAVCNTDAACLSSQANNVCYMDATIRASVQALVDEFEYAKTKYKETVAIAENWRQTQEIRPRRFWSEIMAGAALAVAGASFVMAGAALIKADQAVNIASEAYAMGLRNQNAIMSLGYDIDHVRELLGAQNAQIGTIRDTVVQLGNAQVKASTTMQNNIDAVNGRVADLEAAVNDRLKQVASYVNSVMTQVGSAITQQGRAAIYFQQLTALSNFLVQSSMKLLGQTLMFSTCLQSIYDNKLFGCPIHDPFMAQNPDYAVVTSVYGAVYDGALLSVLFKVPRSVTQTALYTVALKPISVNNQTYVVDATDVVAGAAGQFFRRPFCEGKYCTPLENHVDFTACFAAIRGADVAGVEKFCSLLPCTRVNCTDRLRIHVATGVVRLQAAPLTNFNFKSPTFGESVFDPLVLHNIQGYANVTNINDVLLSIVHNTNTMQSKLNASQAVYDDLITKLGGSAAVMDILNSPLSSFGSSSSNTVVVVMAVLAALLLAGALVGLILYCKYRTKPVHGAASEHKLLLDEPGDKRWKRAY